MTLVERLLKEIEESGSFDDAWVRLYQGPLDVGDKVNEATYTVVPLRRGRGGAAGSQDPLALLVADRHHRHQLPPLPEGVRAGGCGGCFSVRSPPGRSLDAAVLRRGGWGEEASELALACVCSTYHPVGCFIWQGPSPPREDDGDFVRFYCPKCGAEDIWFAHVGDGVAGVLDWENPPQAADDQQPSLEAPPVPDLSGCERPSHPWVRSRQPWTSPPAGFAHWAVARRFRSTSWAGSVRISVLPEPWQKPASQGSAEPGRAQPAGRDGGLERRV